MIILIHSSKTMRPAESNQSRALTQPQLLKKTSELNSYLKTLSVTQLAQSMNLSSNLANITHQLITNWSTQEYYQRAAIDSFLGDIYSGLQVGTLSDEDRMYANKTLRILSGLYGILRPLDGIYPYRLEMGYRLPDEPYKNLYRFWGNTIAATLPSTGPIINLTAVEYSKTILPYVDNNRVVTPSFLTMSPKTNRPTFVTVHTKIARGAYAHWLITHKISNKLDLNGFDEIGYEYETTLSTDSQPVFVCQEFGGKGLSIRLK